MPRSDRGKHNRTSKGDILITVKTSMEQGGEVFIGDVQAAMAEARQSSYRSFPANSSSIPNNGWRTSKDCRCLRTKSPLLMLSIPGGQREKVQRTYKI